jgi:hypothetical protein
MKSNIFATLFILLLPSQVSGQASSSSFAQAFNLLGASRIYNEIMIPDSLKPKVAVLYYVKGTAGGSIGLLSISHEKVRTEWHLAQLPKFMEVIDPANLRVVITDDGPIILLHGCAVHLCGGKGLAGALTYVVNEHQMYTAYASWSNSTKSSKIVYSSGDASLECQKQKKLLDDMLREEHYNP